MMRSWAVLLFVAISAIARGSCSNNPAGRESSENTLGDCVDSNHTAGRTNNKPDPRAEDSSAENELLLMANHSRELAGAPALRVDNSLLEAARRHAELMIAKQQMEHQYPGEADLMQRISQAGPLKIDYAGENIAYATCSTSANEAFMRSPPHRKNLLDQGFNVAGIAAIWNHGKLYVVQDFAHEIASYSSTESNQLVSRAVSQVRSEAGLAEFTQIAPAKLDDAACSLSDESHPNAHLLATSYSRSRIIVYTQTHPEELPQAARRALLDPNAREIAVGSCYARNSTYPTGTYWVAVLLY